MGDRIQCHLLTKVANHGRMCLRRYATGANEKCGQSGYGYHDAEALIGDIENAVPGRDKHHDHADPRWPKKCVCGYEFKDTDSWQYNEDQLWRRDTGELLRLHDAAPGDMWLADWYAPQSGSKFHQARGGGPHLIVLCPGRHHWDVDNKSSNGEGWTRQGEPPNVSAIPSIGVWKANSTTEFAYHGYLTNGWLESC